MDRRAAEEIVPMLVRVGQQAADTIEVYRRYANEAQLRRYADAVGEIVLATDNALRPIINEHPDLDPGGFRN